jgi:uncharacterized protein YndB with AHSA1/START domain
MSQVIHDTIVLERTYDAPISKVFAAFADPKARAQWGPPSDTAVIIYDTAEFKAGGIDSFRCGTQADPKYFGEARYLLIQPEQCIVYSETIDADGARLSASLNTIEFTPLGNKTALKLTVHVAAFAGRDMVEGTRFGHTAALNGLSKYLTKTA